MCCISPVFVTASYKQFEQLPKTDLFEQFPSDHPHTSTRPSLSVNPPTSLMAPSVQLATQNVFSHIIHFIESVNLLIYLAHSVALHDCCYSQAESLPSGHSLQESSPYHSYNVRRQILQSRCYHDLHTHLL